MVAGRSYYSPYLVSVLIICLHHLRQHWDGCLSVESIAGITGASFTTAAAYIADISTNENRAQNFGMIGAAFGLGFIIGPGIGGLLGQFGSRVPFIAAAILCLLNWLWGYFVLPESLAPENRRKFEWKRANPLGAFRLLTRYKGIGELVISLILIYIASMRYRVTGVFLQ